MARSFEHFPKLLRPVARIGTHTDPGFAVLVFEWRLDQNIHFHPFVNDRACPLLIAIREMRLYYF